MKKITIIIILTVLSFILGYFITSTYSAESDTVGCNAYIYIANNTLTDCKITVDGIRQVGKLLRGNKKVYKVELYNDEPRRIKVKVEYEHPEYIEPMSYIMVTKKLQCEQTDSLFISHKL